MKLKPFYLLLLFLTPIVVLSCKDKIEDFDHARDKIINEVIPDTVDHNLQAFMLRKPLNEGDRIAPLGYPEKTKKIGQPTWFCWIDDEPDAEFGHSTRFVYLNARNGELTTEPQTWSPVLNDTIVLWRNSADPAYDSATVFSHFNSR